MNGKESKEALPVLTNILPGKHISGTYRNFTFMDTPCKMFYSNTYILSLINLNLIFDFTLYVRNGFCFRNLLTLLLERKKTVGNLSTKIPIHSLQMTAE